MSQYSPLNSVGLDLEDDFEAQLAAMEQEIDSQYEAALSSRSNSIDSDTDSILDFGLTPPQTANSSQGDGFSAAALSASKNMPKNAYDDNLHSQLNHHDDHIPIDLQDFDSEAESDNENNSLVSTSRGDETVKGPKDGKKGCGDDSCATGGCGEQFRIQQELEDKRMAEEEEQEKRWNEEIDLYKNSDASLSGFIFNEDLTGFQRALATGRHHPEEFDYKGEHTALHHAVFLELPMFIHELMKYGADINVRNFRGETPLMLACKLEDNLDMLRTVIFQYGADIHMKDHVGLHAFHHAAEQGRVFTLSLLHTVLGIDINVVDIYNKNALHWASWAGHTRACEFLLRHGCSPYVQDSVGCYPIHWASAKCQDQVIKILAEFDASEGRSTGLRTAGEKIYTKRLRLLQFGNKFDLNQSTWAQDPSNIDKDPKLLEQKALRKKLDANTLNSYDSDEVYDDFQDLPSYSPIDGIQSVRPSEYPGYKPFGEYIMTPNEDGYSTKEFALKKNAHLEGIDRYYINATTRKLDQIKSSSWFFDSTWGRWFYNEWQRIGYLPIQFCFCYLTALFFAFFVFQPLLSTYFPELMPLLYVFYIQWIFVMYNWWRIVMTPPAKLDLFTPATRNIDSGFGDDGSTTLHKNLPKLDFATKLQYNGNGANDTDELDIDSNNVQDPLASLNSIHNTTDGTKNRKNQHAFEKMEESCQTISSSVCTLDACTPIGHKFPIQRYTVKEFDNISTLHSVYVNMLISGQATEQNCCYTCEIARPLRSKHCSRCNQCVPRFDHHCPFFNQDISYSNYHNFLWFLILVPPHWILLMVMYFKCSSNGLFTEELFPSTYLWVVSGIWSASTAILIFRLWLFHYVLYCIFDILLLAQHISLLAEGLTTNEIINRDRYSYLSFAVKWNPFSRGSFFYNLLAGLALLRHKEPLCLSDDQCKALKYTQSPLESSWAQGVGRRNKQIIQK